MAEKPKTVHEIADLIKAPTPADPPAEATEVADIPLDEGNDVEGEEVLAAEADDAEEDQADEGEPLEEGDEDDEEEEAGDDDADDYLQINDDDLIEVKIDGETVLRSIADAKKALSGEGAIDKRLKEATEARKKAQADHTMLLEQFSLAHRNLMNTVQGMEEIVFKPTVKKPDPALRQSNPNQYLAQVDAYNADQERVEAGRQAIRTLIAEQQQALTQDIEKYRQQQSQMLLETIPSLGDKEVAPKLLQDMSKVAIDVYGYSPEEVTQASDHRLYRMIYDLTQFHNARTASGRKANTVKNLDGQEAKRPRKLRSGATSLKAKARKQADARKQATEVARKTGKVKDVAATLIK